jgi:hypothetical protein
MLLGLTQASPHFVQFDVVPSGVTQPFSGVVHLPQPGLQVGLQMPALHPVPVVLVEPHTVLHAPQLLTSPDTSFSQPSSGLPLQSSNRDVQAGWQVLLLHVLADV